MNEMVYHYFILFYPMFMAGCFAYGMYMLFKFIYDKFWHKLMAKMYCHINIKMDDPPFRWVMRYLQEKKLLAHDNNLRCRIKSEGGKRWWEEIFKVKDEKAKPEVEFDTGEGDHVFDYKGKKIWVSHCIGKTVLTGWENKPTDPEELYIVTYGNDTTILK
jgi:hypothetical protein